MIRWLAPTLVATLGFAAPAAADQWRELYRPLDLPELAPGRRARSAPSTSGSTGRA